MMVTVFLITNYELRTDTLRIRLERKLKEKSSFFDTQKTANREQ